MLKKIIFVILLNMIALALDYRHAQLKIFPAEDILENKDIVFGT